MTVQRPMRIGHNWHALLPVLAGLLACTAESRTGTQPPPTTVPQLGIAPATVSFTYAPGGPLPAVQAVNLTSSPGNLDGLSIGTILYAPISSGWLSADFGSSGNITPSTLVLTATPPADLAPGSYVANVPISSSVTGVHTQYVVATLTVTPTPVLGVSPTAVTLSATQGGANPSAQFVDVDNLGAGTLSGLNLGTVIYGGGASGWISASLSGTTAPATITLQVTSSSLATGTYTAQIPVRSSLPGVVPDTILVSLGVSALSSPPTIAISPAVIPVSAVAGGANPSPQVASVSNSGGGTLAGLSVGTITYGVGANGWLNASINQATAPAQVTVQPTTGTLPAGTYSATVRVQSTQAGVAPATFAVAFTVSATTQPPVIGVAPATPSFTATSGGANPAAVAVSVTNGGGGTLNLLSLGATTYGAGASGWLSASLSNTTAPATITLTAATGALTPGTYTATVPVQSAVSGVSTKNLAVTFVVLSPTASPSIAFAPGDANFTAQTGGGNPAARVVQVTNSGGGSLTGLAVGTISYTSGGASGWLSATLNTTTAPATITVQPTTGALAAGTYRALVPVSSPVAGNSPRNIGVRLDVTGAPAMTLTPGSVTFTGTTGQPSPTPATVVVGNSGGGSLAGLTAGPVSYGAGQPTGWLAATLSGTTTPSTLILTPTTGALAAGNYTATVPVATTTSGVASQTATVSFQVGAPSGGLVILTGNNQSGLVNSVLPIGLKARVYDAAGNPKPGTSVLWQVNNGGALQGTVSTSNSLGEVTANWQVGPLAGIHTVTVSAAGLPTITFFADVLLPPNPSAHPNEPAGYAAFAEHNFSSLPSSPKSLGGLMGAWYNDPTYAPANLVVVTPDLTAPASPPNVLQTRYPTGLVGGRAPVYMYGWDAAGNINGQKSKLYFSLWIKLQGPDFEAAPAITKLGFIGYADAPSVGINQGFFALQNLSSQPAVASSFITQFLEQAPVSRTLGPNVNTSKLMTSGVWHQWEAVYEMNTVGVADGTFKMWIDGIKITDLSNVEWRVAGRTNQFFQWTWNPTWGGIGGTKSRNDFVMIDHVYMSGLP
jgi:hypothetical protein